MVYLTVDLYRDFQCIAGSCSNTCCSGWHVDIDKDTYLKMVEKEEQLGVRASDWLLANHDSYCVKLKNGNCPMLTEDKLCKVVLKLGPEYLSTVCKSYPRELRIYGNTEEIYLSVSCPEIVARLMQKNCIEFEFLEDEKPAVHYAYTKEYLFEAAVRAYITDILQDTRQTVLKARLFYVFGVLDKAIHMFQKHELHADVLRDPRAWEDMDQVMQPQGDAIVDDSLRYQILKVFIQSIINIKRDNKFFELLHESVEYFEQNDLEQYLSDMRMFRERFCNKYSKFYTNFWIYRLFFESMSIPDYEKAKESFLYIAAEMALFQMIAFARFVKNGKLDQEEYLYIISSICRSTEHNEVFRKQVISFLEECNFVSSVGLMLLVII